MARRCNISTSQRLDVEPLQHENAMAARIYRAATSQSCDCRTSERYKFAVSHYCNAATVKCCDSAPSQQHTVAISSGHSIVTLKHWFKPARDKFMKKNREASELAARLAAAARQPAGATSVPTRPQTAPQSPAEPTIARVAAEPARPKKTRVKEPQTVPITLRPDSALWNKFVLKASERTREEGRVISAQQIMLEALERSDA
jgi:hypothetical protein